MTQAISTQKFITMSPKKIRPVADMIRGLTPAQAVEMLPHIEKLAADHLERVVKSAIANAVVKGASQQDLVFKEILIGEGPRLKRGRAASRGRWHGYKRRMSHIRVVVESKTKDTKETKSKKKGKASKA